MEGKLARPVWVLLFAAAALQAGQAVVQVSVPREVDAELGKSVSIPCTYSSSSKTSNVIVEWFITERGGDRQRVAYRSSSDSGTDKNTELSGRVSVDQDSSLSLSVVEIGDEQDYHCQITAGPAGSGEGSAHLRVYSAPQTPEVSPQTKIISVTDLSVSEVSTCTSKNGNPAPKIIWYKDSTPLPEVTESNDNMYMVPRVVKESSGLYTVTNTLYFKTSKEDKDSEFHCQVEYEMPGGRMETKASPKFSLSLHYYTEEVTFAVVTPKKVKEGDDVILKCKADGFPEPEYELTKIQSDGSIVEKGTFSGTFTLHSVTRDDGGKYRCEALDFDSPAEVKLKKEVTLLVHYLDPVTVSPSSSVSVPLGGSLELGCTTTGSKTPSFMWKKGSQVVSQSTPLVLKEVSFEAAGSYSCVASVPGVSGLVKEANTTVTVTGKVQIIDLPYSGRVSKEGELLTLSCTAQGHPEPQISWTPAGLEAISSVTGNKVTSTVTLSVTPMLVDSGVTCEASNEHGSSSKKFKVTIYKETPTVTPPVDTEVAPIHKTANRQEQGGSSAAVIAVVVCVLLLLILVGFLYFLQKKGKLPCGRQGKEDIVNTEANTDEIVVEMKSGKPNEEAGLLDSNGRQRPMRDQ
ncbi:basal cell adhesion molecule-like isoform X1 [Polyodon spathula]|uniref:basal cell adhesion molecule-like isoform X1 n=1 Tax=Polyodon spathula TaxID=7913 RepID=UPI001B7E9C12|nr:basal cell adhesion molecule-like isoform X1 [Polyodon spathula]